MFAQITKTLLLSYQNNIKCFILLKSGLCFHNRAHTN